MGHRQRPRRQRPLQIASPQVCQFVPQDGLSLRRGQFAPQFGRHEQHMGAAYPTNRRAECRHHTQTNGARTSLFREHTLPFALPFVAWRHAIRKLTYEADVTRDPTGDDGDHAEKPAASEQERPGDMDVPPIAGRADGRRRRLWNSDRNGGSGNRRDRLRLSGIDQVARRHEKRPRRLGIVPGNRHGDAHEQPTDQEHSRPGCTMDGGRSTGQGAQQNPNEYGGQG